MGFGGAAGATGVVAASPARAGVSCVTVAGMLTVAIAVDGGQAGAEWSCVVVPQRSTGADVLVARAAQLGRPAPTYDSSGLLCTIDGAPNDGTCGNPTAGGYAYWSYWLASKGTWNYATTGPAGRRVADRSIEGWHFVRGGGTGADQAPRTPPTVTFVDPPPPTVPATTVPAAPNVVAPSGSDGGGVNPSRSPAAGAPFVVPQPGTPWPSPTAPSGGRGAVPNSGAVQANPSTTAGSTAGESPGEATTTAVPSDAATVDAAATPEVTTTTGSVDLRREAAAGATSAPRRAESSASPLLGVAVLVGLLALVGGGVGVRRHRAVHPEPGAGSGQTAGD
jgi:hypothetical protein